MCEETFKLLLGSSTQTPEKSSGAFGRGGFGGFPFGLAAAADRLSSVQAVAARRRE
jgi:hypothetical protein